MTADVVQGDGYTLYNADCLDVLPALEAQSVDAVVTDPPYGIDAGIVANNQERWSAPPKVKPKKMAWDKSRNDDCIPEILRVSKNQVIFGGNYYADILPPSASWIVWNKLNSGVFADCELAWTSHDKAVRQYKYMWDGFRKQIPEERYHPTQKPLSLMVWVLENYTKPGDTIFDPFMGSGTTGVAALLTGRRFIGVELDSDYFQIAAVRIADAARTARREWKPLQDTQIHNDLPLFQNGDPL